MRHPLRKALLVAHLNKELAATDRTDEQKDQIKKLLANSHAVDALVAKCRHTLNFGAQLVSGKLGDGTILKFLFDHREEILAFVKEILKLFHIG